jgi:tetratricopeptide (TPR) repeat protein
MKSKFKISSLISLLVFLLSPLLSPENKEEIVKDAHLFMDMMEYDLAIQNYKKFLTLEPNSIDIRKNIAYAYFRIGWVEEAIKHLKEELTLFPENGDAYDLLVFILYKSNRVEEAYELWEKYNVQIKSKINSPNIGLGDFILWLNLIKSKRFNEAWKYFERAKLRGNYMDMFYIKMIEGKLKGEFTDFQALSESSNLIQEAINISGRTYQLLFLEGIYYYKEFISKSIFYLESKNLPKDLQISIENSIECFKNAIRLKPNFYEAFF